MESHKYSLNKQDLAKIGKGALIALGGALTAYIADTLPNVDFGTYTPLIVGLASVLLNAAIKFFAGQK